MVFLVLSKSVKIIVPVSIVFGLFIAMIAFFGLCFIESSKLYMYLGIISLLSLIIAVILRKSNALFKEIVPKIISSYKEGLTYEHDKGIPSNEYAAARFERWDSYHSEDLIKGKINGCDFIMGEVHTQARNTDSDVILTMPLFLEEHLQL